MMGKDVMGEGPVGQTAGRPGRVKADVSQQEAAANLVEKVQGER